MVGTTVGPYKIQSKIGEGGMVEVFRAMDVNLGRAAAIKVHMAPATTCIPMASGSP